MNTHLGITAEDAEDLDPNSLIRHRNFQLVFKLQTVPSELVVETNIVGCFGQSRSNRSMNGHRGLDHAVGNVVDGQQSVILGVLSVPGGDDPGGQEMDRP